jgi:glutamine synthetase
MSTIVEHVWIGGNYELRSKARVVNKSDVKLEDLEEWNFDGSSTDQANREQSEIFIKPRALFNDPFRKGNHKIVLCDTYLPNGTPAKNNNRFWANSIFEQKKEEIPWFGLEQEYFLIDPKTELPLGFNNGIENTTPQGQYYCSAGVQNAFGRDIVNEHLEACIYAGVKIAGVNFEVCPGQCEFQIGPCTGIEEGDHLWMARYFLHRIGEIHKVRIDFEPKLESLGDGDWNGSGCHANYSTKNMREGNGNKTGLDYINKAIEKLGNKHMEHMAVYGKGNEKRMTGEHETADYYKFSVADIDRGCSIRKGSMTIKNKKGYFEDRRPSSNCDPYLVTGKIYETTVL